MEKIYSLQIHIKGTSMRDLEEILELDKYRDLLNGRYEISLDKNIFDFSVYRYKGDSEFFYIDYFLDILDGKYDELRDKLNIQRDDITIWFLYGYNEICDINIKSQDLKRLGDNSLSLCISSWNKTDDTIDLSVG